MRLWIRGNTAPKLRASVGVDTAGLQSEILRLSPVRVIYGGSGPLAARQVKLNKQTLTPQTERRSFLQNSRFLGVLLSEPIQRVRRCKS